MLPCSACKKLSKIWRCFFSALPAAGLVALLAGCVCDPDLSVAETHRGPVVVITVSDLRADLVGSLNGEPGWTPKLDRFAGEAGWVGRAVSASSSPVPALASLVTGVDPWQHGVLSHLFFQRRPDLPTLAEATTELGFKTRLFTFRDGSAQFGGFDGFSEVSALGNGKVALNSLRELSGEPELLWIHLPLVGFPYRDRRDRNPALSELPEPSRPALSRVELLPFADPNKPIPKDLLEAAKLLYRHEVSWVDLQIGRYLQALRESGKMDQTLVVVTALHGTELGEHDQVLFAQNLCREVVEVPLMIRWPEGKKRQIDTSTSPVELTRLWSTFADELGFPNSPVHLPSLYQTSKMPALSSLFLHDATNRFSVVVREGDSTFQASMKVLFAAPEPKFFAAQVAEAGWLWDPRQRMAQAVRGRLLKSFERTPPLSGLAENRRGIPLRRPQRPQVEVFLWREGGGVEPISDPALAARMVTVLERRWRRFVDQERSPIEERRYWSG